MSEQTEKDAQLPESVITGAIDKSIKETRVDILSEYSEILLDSLTKDNTLDEIPVIKTVSGVYRLVSFVRAKRFHRKMQAFLDELRSREASEEETSQFREKFENDQEYREKVMEHLIEQIDLFDSSYKAKVLARLFVAFTQNYISWRRFTDLSNALNRAHIMALERLAIQDEHTIPPDGLRRPTWDQGIPIQAHMESAVLMEASGLAMRPQTPLEGTANIYLTGLGLDMLVYGVKPDGPWKATLNKMMN